MSSTMSMKSMMSMLRMMSMKRSKENGVYDVHDAHRPNTYGSASRAPVVVSPENTAHMFTYCSQLSIYSMHLLTALAQQPQNRAAPWRVSPLPYAIRHTLRENNAQKYVPSDSSS